MIAVKILLRADSGFARGDLMAWCEENQVDYLFGLARNPRLQTTIRPELAQAKALSDQHEQPVRRFKDFLYDTLDSWSRKRRVVAKAEVLPRGPNTSTSSDRKRSTYRPIRRPLPI